ncbi:MAG: type II secretion system major pseudopilin GspG [Kiritimatiellae bacterium]|nr:type II secretion system major pseudopilin GspG [Kiritimatiellia bacterium]
MKSAGFTLLEVIVAITIAVILASVVGVNVLGLPQKHRRDAAKMQIEAFKTALALYQDDNGVFPSARQGLAALVEPSAVAPVPTSFRDGGYLESLSLPADPWGRPYAYIVPGPGGKPFDIVCYGADGEEGGTGVDADIAAWD